MDERNSTAPTISTLLREPQSVPETGLNPGLLNDLALKVIYFNGELTGQAIAGILKLPYTGVIDRILGFLIKED
jgi:hypothetical protein